MIGYDLPNDLGKMISPQLMSDSEASDLETVTETSKYFTVDCAKTVISCLMNIGIDTRNMTLVHHIRRLLKYKWRDDFGYQRLSENPQISQTIKQAVEELDSQIVLHYQKISQSW